MKKKETTLLLLRKENEILLAMKKRGFGTGKYNGVGGKIEEDDRYWLPPILEGKKIKGFFEYDEDWNLLSHQITEL